jgi:hypothetical protein
MPGNVILRSISRCAGACATVLSLAGCSPATTAPAVSAVLTPVPPGAARIWIYRDYEPYGSRNFAPVTLNGVLTGNASPDGSAFYRDVAPGQYHIAAVSDGTDVNQDRRVDLALGQQAFVKILSSVSWESGGDMQAYRRDTFYVSLVPPQVARTELPTHPLSGG